jgi:hypothetical protein
MYDRFRSTRPEKEPLQQPTVGLAADDHRKPFASVRPARKCHDIAVALR